MRLLQRLEVSRPEGHEGGDSWYSNDDLLPVPPSQRLWKNWNYITFWLADSFNLNSFMIASSIVGSGMSWWAAWLTVWVGYSVAACFLVLNAYAGAKYHIIFPAYIRASFGTLGALWPVFNRAGMACIWWGVQAWIGGECMYALLCAIWPSTRNLSNTPLSSTDVGRWLGFFLFWLLSLVPMWWPMHTIRHFFTLKAIVAPIAGLGLFGWCIARAGGAGDALKAPTTIHGSNLGWLFVASTMSCISNMATLITNVGIPRSLFLRREAVDFASRANTPKAVIVPQLIALPVCFSMVSLFGILIASSTTVIFGEFVWSPLDILTRFLEEPGTSHGTRAGVAFIVIGFIIAQIGTNIAANSLSAGCDLTSLAPRFINIRRGGYVAAIVGLCMCPWKLLESSNLFTSYLSAYSVFLSSICGVMLSHYYIVASRQLKVDDLYVRYGVYEYYHGFNLRAYAAYIAGIAPNLPGFIGAVGKPAAPAARHIYELSFFVGCGVSGLVYVLLCKAFPLPEITEDEANTVTVGREAAELGLGSMRDGSYSEKDDFKSEEYATVNVAQVV
ncbi:BQ5605_C033g11170 [Microbotryum silenes-dioicae]|uniref:BQ5605_C033g11170 protein n=1 Tax=Microbotryum silenes-dioicae TaxID=796604 RepID=A0A2X0MGW3_9BASI|nr:BQ5605_C033g11170 [Microbotryum silenes-dioicae]